MLSNPFPGGHRPADSARKRLACRLLATLLPALLAGCGLRSNLPPHPATDAEGTPAAVQPKTFSIALVREAIRQGEVLKGRVEGPWAPPPAKCYALLWIDGLGRVLAASQLQPAPGVYSAPFELTIQDGLGRWQRLALLEASQPAQPGVLPEDWRVLAEAPFLVAPETEPLRDYLVFLQDPEGDANPLSWQIQRLIGISGIAAVKQPPHWNPLPVQTLPRIVAGGLPAPLGPLGGLSEEGAKNWLAAFLKSREPAAWKPGLFDEELLAQSAQSLDRFVQSQRPYGPWGYLLADRAALGRENWPLERMPDPNTLELYQAWLRERYHHLAALNGQYGSHYKDWREIRPPSTDEVKSAHLPGYAAALERIKAGDPEKHLARDGERPIFLPPGGAFPASDQLGGENFSAWCDYREFLDFAFTRLLAEYRSQLARLDPHAQAGLSGLGEPSTWGCSDWARLAQILDWCLPQTPGLGCELYKSFKPAGYCFLRSSGDSPAARQALWEAWLSNGDGLFLTPSQPLLAGPGQALTPYGQALAADLRLLSGGLTAQRNAFQPQRSKIALYYSTRSQAVHWLLDSRADGSEWPRRGADGQARDSQLLALQAWSHLLRDLGYEPTFVSRETLLRQEGRLEAQVLILPKTLCLGGPEAQAIRSFAKTGGLVIADSQCGLFDGSGKRRALPPDGWASGALDEDFGVQRDDFSALEANGSCQEEDAAGGVRFWEPRRPVPMGPRSAELRINEPGLRQAAAWQYGRTEQGIPALLIRSGGLGRFVYLNLALQDYPALRTRSETDFQLAGMDLIQYTKSFGRPTGGEALRVLLGDLLTEHLGEEELSIRSLGGQALRGIRRTVWRAGAEVLVAFLPTSATPKALPEEAGSGSGHAQILYARPLHWYNPQRGTYLGHGTQVALPLEPPRATLAVGLPYRITHLRALCRRVDPLGTFRVSLVLETQGQAKERPGPHALRIQVQDPQGRHLPHYDRTVLSNGGQWSGQISLGQNEPAGAYTWTARHLISGMEAKVILNKDAMLYEKLFPAEKIATGGR